MRKFWTGKLNVSGITMEVSQENKLALKTEVVDTIMEETDNSIRRLLAEVFRIMVEFDYPQNWENLLPTLMTMAQTDNVLRMHNALVLLRQLAKRYEFKMKYVCGGILKCFLYCLMCIVYTVRIIIICVSIMV